MLRITLFVVLVVFTFISPVIAADKIEIMVSYPNQPGEPIDLAMKYWAKILEEKSNGTMTMTTFPSGQLGGQEDVRAQAQMGAPIITATSYGSLADLVPDLGVINSPYIGTSADQKIKFLNTPKIKTLIGKLDEKGLHMICPDMYYGTRQLMTDKKVTNPSEMNGVKIRVQNTKIAGYWAESVGAVPTPMPLSEAYTAISQGIVEGIENPPGTLYGGKFYEPLKYLIMTNHTVFIHPWVMGKAFYDTLTPEQQELLNSTSKEVSAYGTKLIKETEQSYIDKMVAEGVEVIKVDMKPYQENARKVMKGNFPEWSPNLYENTLQVLDSL